MLKPFVKGLWATSVATALCCGYAAPANAQEGAPPPEYPPIEKVTEGYRKITPPEGQPAFYNVWIKDKDSQLLAELPAQFAQQRHFFALTVSSGDTYAGLQAGDLYVYWRQHGNRLALIAPNLDIRSNGDPESKSSVKRLFTDRVLLDVPIVSWVPRGGPVIDLDALLVGQAAEFFGPDGRTTRPQLARVVKAKVFPQNIEIGIELPAADGHLQILSYSISLIPDSTGYEPRKADERVGYFTTSFSDLGQYDDETVQTRFINRWHLEKRDPSLKVSPPKKPIVFYIEHTTPVRYRRWVREGIEYWNTAFEKVGLDRAIVVEQQDSQTGAFMNIDPEDVNYNFVRWLNNNIGTAIGPSRVHPLTGQILDADIILTDGWIRHFETQFTEVMPKVAMEGMSAETLAWLEENPSWDPRVRLADPTQRALVQRRLQQQAGKPYGGHEMANLRSILLGDDQFDGLIGRTSQTNGLCMAGEGRAFDVAIMRMMLEVMAQEGAPAQGTDPKKPEEPKEQMLDGIPESFIGPLLADLVAHEVGHTLGLRHNFKASSVYTYAQINSEEFKGKKAFTGSVMDYIPINYHFEGGGVQGDYGMIGLGPYDYWAIEYGYTFEKDLSKLLARNTEPELTYATDEDTGGPDPLARRYDFTKDPVDFAANQVRIAEHNRKRILEHFVKDGDSWSKARRGYELTLRMQTSATSMLAGWLGGTFVNRNKKGDPNSQAPLTVVPAEQQRKALKFMLEHTFKDEVYGLNPELLKYMTVDKWLDGDTAAIMNSDPAWPIHDRIMGIQASTLTQIMNPTTLRQVYDNEFRVSADEDMVTLPEVMQTVSDSIWGETDAIGDQQYTARKPLISSLRRNLQREHVDRLIDLMIAGGRGNAASKPIANLASAQLETIGTKIKGALEKGGDKLDPYSKSHLKDTGRRIEKALNADYILNPAAGAAPAGGGRIIIGNEATPTTESNQ